MSPMIVTYIGFVVAILILLWGVLVVSRRYWWRGNVRRRADVWIPLKPEGLQALDEPEQADEEESDKEALNLDFRARAQQNGHYSESKKSL